MNYTLSNPFRNVFCSRCLALKQFKFSQNSLLCIPAAPTNSSYCNIKQSLSAKGTWTWFQMLIWEKFGRKTLLKGKPEQLISHPLKKNHNYEINTGIWSWQVIQCKDCPFRTIDQDVLYIPSSVILSDKKGSSLLINCEVISTQKNTCSICPNKSFYASKTLLLVKGKKKGIPKPPKQHSLPNYVIFIKKWIKNPIIFVILLHLYHTANPTFSYHFISALLLWKEHLSACCKLQSCVWVKKK